MGLREYQRKRDFSKTREPAGQARSRIKPRPLQFVVQKHAASRLHYDFRLELDGVLKSWAVPKGPSLDPSHKQLAVEVEDHPLDYADFEGTIPAGQYGGGEVIVWDRGVWIPAADPRRGLQDGQLSFALDGDKLRGNWTLVRMKNRGRKKNDWLLIKRRDEHAQAGIDITSERPESVKSQRLIEDLREQALTLDTPSRTKNSTIVRSAEKLSGAKPSLMPRNLAPQLATLASEPPHGDNWVHEVKFDGYRLLAYVERGRVRLMTRNKQDWTHRYGVVARALTTLPVDSAVVDGELVALRPDGVSSFAALQQATKGDSALLMLYAFDLLYLNGYDLRSCSLVDRKRALASILPPEHRHLQLSEHFAVAGDQFLGHCRRLGLEGMISKRLDRRYIAGRGRDWLKSKCQASEELVIGGYALSAKMPRGFGALLLGYFVEDKLEYAGRVGTGFSAELLVELRHRLDGLQQKTSPFRSIPSREVDRTVRWVRPALVARVTFTNWTDSGVLRHPAFQGLRADKAAEDVGRPASLALAPAEESVAVKKSSRSAKNVKKKLPASRPAPRQPTSVSVMLTHPERVLFPQANLTKLDLATYYAQVAPWMLPHVVDRPLSLVRCPSGQGRECFFQKHSAAGTPAELGRVKIQQKNEEAEYLYVRDVEGLAALAQISVLEVHVWGALRDKVDRPDRLIFDLDPDPDVPWQGVVAAALAIRELLDEQGLTSFVRTTGGKGLHVVAPLAPRRHDWAAAKAFARQVAEQLAAREPGQYTTNMSKAARRGKIFLDFLRNDAGSTAVASYSPRARPLAPVAMPIAWDDLPDITPGQFTLLTALSHLQSRPGDPWAEMASLTQNFGPQIRRRRR